MSLYRSHYEELKNSCISDEIIDRDFISLEGDAAQEWLIGDALEKLGAHSQQYTTRPVQWLRERSEHVRAGGWVCTANGQIKPDEPRQAVERRDDGEWVPAFNKDGTPKLVKYESKREKPYAGAHVGIMRPIGSIKRESYIINEGAKKAAASATLGYRAIGLPGVDMATISGTDSLIPAIAGLHRDADIVIAFDSDKEQSTRDGVARSIARLGRLLTAAGFTSVRVASWDASAGKGLDDIFASKGANFVHAAINKAEQFSKWQAFRVRQWQMSQVGYTLSAIDPKAQADTKISKFRASRQKLVQRLDQRVLLPLRQERDNEIAEARLLYKQLAEEESCKKEIEALKEARQSRIKTVRATFKETWKRDYKPVLDRIKKRCDEGIEQARSERDKSLALESEAQRKLAKHQEAAHKRFVEKLRGKNRGFYELTDPNRKIINQRYVDINLPAPSSILAISSSMETGKTVAGGKLKDEFFRRHPNGLFDLQGYRNGLGQQTAGKWGMDHISDLEASAPGISQRLIDDASSLAYCLDSLNRRARAINEAIADGRKVCVFLDEGDAVLKHVIGGGTLGKRQAEIWKLWCETLAAVIANGGYIVIAEASLSQIAVDAIAEISGGKVQAVENKYQPHKGRKVIDYSALSAKGKHSDQLLAKACLTHVRQKVIYGPVFLATDSQGFAEKAEAALVADGYKVLRIDGDTIERPETNEFLKDPDKYIEDCEPDAVIVTTTAESGVSISEGYFTDVVLYGSHLEDRALCQLSGRVRGDAPLHLFVKRRVDNFGEDPDLFSVDGILKEWQQNAADSFIAADVEKYFDAETLKAASERTQSIEAQQLHRFKAIYQARCNISRFSLHYGVISILKAMGADISCEALQPSTFEKDDIVAFEKAGAVVVDRRTSEFVQAPIDKSVSWAIRVEGSASSTRSDRTAAKKILLNDSYPDLPLDDDEFVRKEIIKGRGNTLRAHAFAWLCRNPKIAKIIDLQSWKAQLEQQFMVLPALRKESARVKVLAQSALADIAKLESYEETTPLVVAVAQWAKERRKTLERLFRLRIKDTQTNIAIVNKLLRKIGYKSKSIARPGSREDRRQIWNAEAEPYQAEVWASLEQKWIGELSDENIEVEQPSAPVSLICNKRKSIMQINDTKPKSPVDSGGGADSYPDFSRFKLADLVSRFGNFEAMLRKAPKSEIHRVPPMVLAQFADA